MKFVNSEKEKLIDEIQNKQSEVKQYESIAVRLASSQHCHEIEVKNFQESKRKMKERMNKQYEELEKFIENSVKPMLSKITDEQTVNELMKILVISKI